MIRVLDPLTDSRWIDLLERHRLASVFHSRGWLEALKRTYGYEPVALTTTRNGPLENGLVLCSVAGWRWRRLVSLPFSDHCDPLVERPKDLDAMLELLRGQVEKGHYRSLEIRPFGAHVGRGFSLADTPSYYLHRLDLSRPSDQIFAAFNHSNTQRAIRRAEREDLEYEAGVSAPLLESFYRLLRMTRRRHGLPPQPVAWFQNLLACLGDAVTIHVASKDGQPVAAILTLSFGRTLVYKYGGSDAAQHRLGGMPFLFWRAIQAAKARGIEEMDLGRSDADEPGLVAFKDHLGAARTTLTYFRWPEGRTDAARSGALSRASRHVMAHLPDAALDLTGRLLYRHMG